MALPKRTLGLIQEHSTYLMEARFLSKKNSPRRVDAQRYVCYLASTRFGILCLYVVIEWHVLVQEKGLGAGYSI